MVAPKDKGTIKQKSEMIYWYRCSRLECDEDYTLESARTFRERFIDHHKALSPIFDC